MNAPKNFYAPYKKNLWEGARTISIILISILIPFTFSEQTPINNTSLFNLLLVIALDLLHLYSLYTISKSSKGITSSPSWISFCEWFSNHCYFLLSKMLFVYVEENNLGSFSSISRLLAGIIICLAFGSFLKTIPYFYPKIKQGIA